MANGQIVSTEITVGLLMKAVSSAPHARLLIDGFPRGMEQAIYLENHFREIDFIINFDCPEDVLVDRLVKRGTYYSIFFNYILLMLLHNYFMLFET